MPTRLHYIHTTLQQLINLIPKLHTTEVQKSATLLLNYHTLQSKTKQNSIGKL